MGERDQSNDPSHAEFVRDPLAVPEAVMESRSRPMAERLEQALSMNSLLVELQAAMREAKSQSGE